jgi:trans-aconitate methyltransferase
VRVDRERAEAFDDASRYDRTRPSYPDELVADLLAGRPATIFDVGCGTGIASRLFRGDGRELLGVEPDPRMAAVARAHGLRVEAARFEEWDPRAGNSIY